MPVEFWNNITLIKRVYDQCLEPLVSRYQLTRTEIDILLFLANNPGCDTATDIVNRRKLTKSHVSASVGALVERRYIERVFQPDNRKNVHLKLLPAADELVRDGQRAQRRFYTTILQGLTPAEVERMEAAFAVITRNARAALEEGETIC